MKKGKAWSPANTSCSEEETWDFMVSLHSAPHQHYPAQSAIASICEVPIEVDSSSDGGFDPGKANLFGNIVFDDPSFHAHKHPAAEKAVDLQWDEEEQINKMELGAKATAIRACVKE
jgi:hypothetical protein